MSAGTRTWQVPGIERWPQRGGAACLDFANTVAFRPTGNPVDGLLVYDDLLGWSTLAGVLAADESARLAVAASRDETGAIVVLDSAHALRDSIFDVFQSLAAGQSADPIHLATIAAWRIDGMKHATLIMDAGAFGFAFGVPADVLALTRPLWQIAESATQLLLSPGWRRVHQCPGDDCGWLFLDQTKNGNRRWCDSADCGNRARGRTFAQRHRQRQQR